jgi:hypothetical protein
MRKQYETVPLQELNKKKTSHASMLKDSNHAKKNKYVGHEQFLKEKAETADSLKNARKKKTLQSYSQDTIQNK